MCLPRAGFTAAACSGVLGPQPFRCVFCASSKLGPEWEVGEAVSQACSLAALPSCLTLPAAPPRPVPSLVLCPRPWSQLEASCWACGAPAPVCTAATAQVGVGTSLHTSFLGHRWSGRPASAPHSLHLCAHPARAPQGVLCAHPARAALQGVPVPVPVPTLWVCQEIPRHPKMRPLPPTASQEKSHVPS